MRSAAAKEAFEDAGIEMEKEDPLPRGRDRRFRYRKPADVWRRTMRRSWTKGPNRVNPLMVPLMISNMAAGNVSIQLGLKGKMYKCRDGLRIRHTLYRRCLPCHPVRGCGCDGCRRNREHRISRRGSQDLRQLTALSTANRSGRVLPVLLTRTETDLSWEREPVLLLLEELEHAKSKRREDLRRACRIRQQPADAYHITSPAEDGERRRQWP